MQGLSGPRGLDGIPGRRGAKGEEGDAGIVCQLVKLENICLQKCLDYRWNAWS